jgi:hypothetical protein
MVVILHEFFGAEMERSRRVFADGADQSAGGFLRRVGVTADIFCRRPEP